VAHSSTVLNKESNFPACKNTKGKRRRRRHLRNCHSGGVKRITECRRKRGRRCDLIGRGSRAFSDPEWSRRRRSPRSPGGRTGDLHAHTAAQTEKSEDVFSLSLVRCWQSHSVKWSFWAKSATPIKRALSRHAGKSSGAHRRHPAKNSTTAFPLLSSSSRDCSDAFPLSVREWVFFFYCTATD
jgi:hypothetical protein